MDNYTLLMYPIPSFCFVPKATDYTILPFFLNLVFINGVVRLLLTKDFAICYVLCLSVKIRLPIGFYVRQRLLFLGPIFKIKKQYWPSLKLPEWDHYMTGNIFNYI